MKTFLNLSKSFFTPTFFVGIALFVLSACEKEEATPTATIPPVNAVKDPCQVSFLKNSFKVNGVDGEIESIEYAFDKAANKLTQTKNSKKFGTSIPTTYSYDNKNRLIEENSALGYRKYSYTSEGKLSEYAIDMQGNGGLRIYKYNYKNATTIEKHEYQGSVTDANLKRTTVFTIDANNNVTKADNLTYTNGKYTRTSLQDFVYNDKGQLLTETYQYSATSTNIYRYEYDAAGNHTKTFLKVNNKAESIDDERSDFTPIPTPKVSFTEWQLGVAEPYNYGKILSNFGILKRYSEGVVSSEFIRKYEYDTNNILIKTTKKDIYKNSTDESTIERTIKCQ